MCSRYLLLERHYLAVLRQLGIAAPVSSPTRYNIAPGIPIAAIRQTEPAGAHEAVALQWGLVPRWAKSASQKIVNARAETVMEKPAFRDALRSRRCAIPASGFYEWKSFGRARQPWLFRRKDEEPFVLAGLWESWRNPDGSEVNTCAVITTAPNELMLPIHDRMPVMLGEQATERWLDPALTEPADLSTLFAPWPANQMSALHVSSKMNNVRYDAPDCIRPAEDEARDQPQLSLGL
jgi:putative SOS response-associated peptidase YedK